MTETNSKTPLNTENSTLTEEKGNEATAQRPEGDRLINAELVEIDLAATRHLIKSETAWANGDRNAITLFKNENMRILMIGLHANAEMKTHTAPGVISVQVLEGNIKFHTENKTLDLSTGHMLSLAAGVPHSVRASQESVFLLTIAVK